MRKEWGQKALRALAGALILALTTVSGALATPGPELVRATTANGHATAVTLGSALDRSAIAPYREHARIAAVAAAYARAHPVHKATPHHPRKAARPSKPSVPVVRNHLWIPALGISRAVQWFPCSRSTAPGPYVYRWGCAGRNNVYLFGHAGGVFEALHDAYVNGTLRVGMVAIYADRYGHRHSYRVTDWKVVSPSDISWSGSTRTPSMTLQTCVGTRSQYRLDVRLVAA